MGAEPFRSACVREPLVTLSTAKLRCGPACLDDACSAVPCRAMLCVAVLHPDTCPLEGGGAQREVPGVTHVDARPGQQHVLDASSSSMRSSAPTVGCDKQGASTGPLFQAAMRPCRLAGGLSWHAQMVGARGAIRPVPLHPPAAGCEPQPNRCHSAAAAVVTAAQPCRGTHPAPLPSNNDRSSICTALAAAWLVATTLTQL